VDDHPGRLNSTAAGGLQPAVELLAGPWRANFFTMWGGQLLSLAGSRVVQFALIWWLTRETGSATVLTTAAIVGLVPEIALSPIAGAYVDRWNRRLIILFSDALIALASLVLAYLFWQDLIQVWHIYVLLFIRATLGSFHLPSIQASTSLMVPEIHLSRVAGLNQLVGGALTIVSPPIGALLIELLPFEGVMLVDVITAALAIVPLLWVTVPQPPGRKGEAAGNSLRADLGQGLRYVLGWPGLLGIVGMALTVKLMLTPAFAVLPLLVKDYFGGGPPELSLLEAILGVGLVLGGALLTVWGGFRRRIFTSLLGLVALGASLLLLGLAPADTFPLALAATLIIGLAVPLVDGPIMAIMQATVAPEMQGRVFTLTGSLISLSSPVGLALAGPLSDQIGLAFWYLAAGGLCILAGIGLFFVPAVVNIERVEKRVERGEKREERRE